MLSLVNEKPQLLKNAFFFKHEIFSSRQVYIYSLKVKNKLFYRFCVFIYNIRHVKVLSFPLRVLVSFNNLPSEPAHLCRLKTSPGHFIAQQRRSPAFPPFLLWTSVGEQGPFQLRLQINTHKAFTIF